MNSFGSKDGRFLYVLCTTLFNAKIFRLLSFWKPIHWIALNTVDNGDNSCGLRGAQHLVSWANTAVFPQCQARGEADGRTQPVQIERKRNGARLTKHLEFEGNHDTKSVPPLPSPETLNLAANIPREGIQSPHGLCLIAKLRIHRTGGRVIDF